MAALATIFPHVGYVPGYGVAPLSETPGLFLQCDIQAVWDLKGLRVETR